MNEAFENIVRTFIKSTVFNDEISLEEYLKGYKMFLDFDTNSSNHILKSALAKTILETKIKEIINDSIDLYSMNQVLNEYIDEVKLELLTKH